MPINTATKIYTSLDMQICEMFCSEQPVTVHQQALEEELEQMANQCIRNGFVKVSGTLISILDAVRDIDVNWVFHATQMLDPICAMQSKRSLENILRPGIIEFIRQVYGSK